MKTLSYIAAGIAAMTAACSCESSFPLNLEQKGDQILVEGFITRGDTTHIRFQRAVGFNGDKRVSSDIEMTKVELSIAGEPVEVTSGEERSTWYSSAEPETRNERMVLRAEAEGMQPVIASTYVPDNPEMEGYNLEIATDDFGEYLKLDIKVPGRPSENDYYGIMVIKEKTAVRKSGVEVSCFGEAPTMRSLDNTLLANLWGGNNITFNFHENIHGYERCQMTIFDGREFRDGTYSFYMKRSMDGWNEDTNSADSYRYKALFFRLSPEYYNYNKAKYSAENNRLAGAGFCPPNFTFSNVNGGYGVFAGLSFVETEWMDNP